MLHDVDNNILFLFVLKLTTCSVSSFLFFSFLFFSFLSFPFSFFFFFFFFLFKKQTLLLHISAVLSINPAKGPATSTIDASPSSFPCPFPPTDPQSGSAPALVPLRQSQSQFAHDCNSTASCAGNRQDKTRQDKTRQEKTNK